MLRVCLIDDEYDVTEILKEELEATSEEIRVTRIAHNIEDAKRVIDTFLPLIDCFIVDMTMPASASSEKLERDAGLLILSYLRQTKHFTGTIIILTNSCEFEDGKRAFEIGCDVYLCKSRQLDDLIDAIQFCMQRRLDAPDLQHFFLPEEITSREARLMEMLYDGKSWQEIAFALRYSNAGAARIAAEDTFNKLLAWHAVAPPIDKKRDVAMQLWKWRHVSHAPAWEVVAEVPHRTSISEESRH